MSLEISSVFQKVTTSSLWGLDNVPHHQADRKAIEPKLAVADFIFLHKYEGSLKVKQSWPLGSEKGGLRQKDINKQGTIMILGHFSVDLSKHLM